MLSPGPPLAVLPGAAALRMLGFSLALNSLALNSLALNSLALNSLALGSVALGSLALGCGSAAHAQGLLLQGEELLERGGELGEQWPARSLELTGDLVRVWGISEVPEGSRPQLALSAVDAIARAELLKAVRVRLESVLLDVEGGATERSALSLRTVESVSGVLDRAEPLPHGWARIRRGDAVVLRLWARLDVQRSALEAALRAPLSSAGGDARVFVSGLGARSEGAAP